MAKTKSTNGPGSKHENPLFRPTQTRSRRDSPAASRRLPRGTARHILRVEPATSFEYRYESPRGNARIIHLERGALESLAGAPQAVRSFRITVSPAASPTRAGIFTSPDSIALTAEAIVLIEGGASGDSIICRSFGSFDGLKVTLTIFSENDDGSISRILREEIEDANEHRFLIP
jgi:hypothetical protein